MIDILIMVTRDGHFYPVTDPADDLSAEEKAKAHGEINDHIVQVEDLGGTILWRREDG